MSMKPAMAAIVMLAGCGSRDFLDREYVAGYRHSPPNELTDERGRPFGFTVDLTTEAARRAGIRLRWVHAPEGPDQAFAHHAVDLWPLLVALPERTGHIHFTRPYREGLYAMAVLAGSGIGRLEEFGPRRLTSGNIWWLQRQVRTAFPSATPIPSSSQDEAIAALCRGQVDGALLAINSDTNGQVRPQPDCRNQNLRLLPLGGHGTSSGIGASRRNPGAIAAAERLRNAIDTMADDETMAGITLKWFGTAGPKRSVVVRLSEEHRWNLILLASLLAAGALAGVLAALTIRYKRATREAEEARRQAERANQVKSEFLTTLSHELRTPIIGVLGMTESIVTGPLNAAQREAASVISRSSESLLALIDDMLTSAKLEAGHVAIDSRPFELWTVIEETTIAMEGQARKRGLELSFDFDRDLPWTTVGDPLRLRQVLLNLVANAVKFTETGGVTVSARAAGWNGPEARVRVSVTDTGPGIPSDKQHLLFERFSQVDSSPSRTAGGTGLGLAISRQLVQAMGGTIGLLSSEGRPGADFWFELPLPVLEPESFHAAAGSLVSCRSGQAALQARRQIEAWSLGEAIRIEVEDHEEALHSPVRPSALRRAIQHAAKAPAPKPSLRLAGRVLLVEDNTINQKVASALLLKLGLQVDVASDGGVALERCRTQRYDAILMDCTMPGMDGYEATRRIRAMERGTSLHTPIIALTANALEDARRECLEAGMDDFANKPVRLDTLKPLLATWLGSSG